MQGDTLTTKGRNDGYLRLGGWQQGWRKVSQFESVKLTALCVRLAMEKEGEMSEMTKMWF